MLSSLSWQPLPSSGFQVTGTITLLKPTNLEQALRLTTLCINSWIGTLSPSQKRAIRVLHLALRTETELYGSVRLRITANGSVSEIAAYDLRESTLTNRDRTEGINSTPNS